MENKKQMGVTNGLLPNLHGVAPFLSPASCKQLIKFIAILNEPNPAPSSRTTLAILLNPGRRLCPQQKEINIEVRQALGDWGSTSGHWDNWDSKNVVFIDLKATQLSTGTPPLKAPHSTSGKRITGFTKHPASISAKRATGSTAKLSKPCYPKLLETSSTLVTKQTL
jgi:hypothetical protein